MYDQYNWATELTLNVPSINQLNNSDTFFLCVCSVIVNSLWPPMDHSLPASPVHGILQARILELVVKVSL